MKLAEDIFGLLAQTNKNIFYYWCVLQQKEVFSSKGVGHGKEIYGSSHFGQSIRSLNRR
jgi:hypothetical protein